MGKHSRSAQKKAKQRNSKKVLSPPDNEDPPETSLEDDREDSKAPSPEPGDSNTENPDRNAPKPYPDEIDTTPPGPEHGNLREISPQESHAKQKSTAKPPKSDSRASKLEVRPKRTTALDNLVNSSTRARDEQVGELIERALQASREAGNTVHDIDLFFPLDDESGAMRKGTFKTYPKTNQGPKRKASKQSSEPANSESTLPQPNDERTVLVSENDVGELVGMMKKKLPTGQSLEEFMEKLGEEIDATEASKGKAAPPDTRREEMAQEQGEIDPNRPYLLWVNMTPTVIGEHVTREVFTKIEVAGYAHHHASKGERVAYHLLAENLAPKAIILIDSVLASDRHYCNLAKKLVEYVRNGGTLICFNIFRDEISPFSRRVLAEPDFNLATSKRRRLPLFRFAGLPWEYGDCLPSVLTSNDRAIPEEYRGMMPDILYSQGMLLKEVAFADAWYIQTPASVADAINFEGKGMVLVAPPRRHTNGIEVKDGGDTKNRNDSRDEYDAKSKAEVELRTAGVATTEWTSFACAKVGKGRLGWIADMAFDRHGHVDEVLMAMAGLKISETAKGGKAGVAKKKAAAKGDKAKA